MLNFKILHANVYMQTHLGLQNTLTVSVMYYYIYKLLWLKFVYMQISVMKYIIIIIVFLFSWFPWLEFHILS